MNYTAEESKSSIIGGILAIVATFILFFIGTWSSGQYIYYVDISEKAPLYLLLTAIAFPGFVAGLIGGVFALKKEKSAAILGTCVAIAVSFLMIVMSVLFTILLIGIPTLILLALSIYCVAKLPMPRARPKRLKPAPTKPAGLFCPHCKIELPADSVFCPECGRRLKKPRRK